MDLECNDFLFDEHKFEHFLFQKFTIDNECIIFKKNCANVFIIRLLVYNESSFNVFKIKLFTTRI